MAVPKRQIDAEQTPTSTATDWRSVYDSDDLSAVEAFVARYPCLNDLLSRVPGEVEARFESSARPRLSVSQEPDSDGDEPDEWLTITIEADREWRDARARLQRFEDEWWLDAMPRGEPLIAILPRFP